MGSILSNATDPPSVPSSTSKFGLFQAKPSHLDRLHFAEKRLGYTLDDLHNAHVLLENPELPNNMSAALLPNTNKSCKNLLYDLERCIQKSVIKNENTNSNPYGRLAGCKPQWTYLYRCSNMKESKILKVIQKWEVDYVSKLEPASRQDYLYNLSTKYKYYQYCLPRLSDATEKARMARHLNHVDARIQRLNKETFFSNTYNKSPESVKHQYKSLIEDNQNYSDYNV